MVAVAVALWGGITLVGGADVSPEVGFGMAAPLVAAVGSWLVTARAHRAAPERVTGVMVVAFGVKALLFGGYVVAGVRGMGLRPVPFALSFAGFLIALYAVEAYFLRQLFAGSGQLGSRD